MDWPAQSPGFNLIENAWALLKKRLRPRDAYPSNSDELFSVLLHEWNTIPDTYFTALIDSMLTRAAIVKINNGKSSKYRMVFRNVE